MAGMIKRLDAVRDTLVAAQREYTHLADDLRRLEGRRPDDIPQEQWTGMLGEAKRNSATTKTNVDRLTAEEAQLAQDLTGEQGRWVDLSQRLDELERTLSKR